jgi:hypothetical protein
VGPIPSIAYYFLQPWFSQADESLFSLSLSLSISQSVFSQAALWVISDYLPQQEDFQSGKSATFKRISCSLLSEVLRTARGIVGIQWESLKPTWISGYCLHVLPGIYCRTLLLLFQGFYPPRGVSRAWSFGVTKSTHLQLEDNLCVSLIVLIVWVLIYKHMTPFQVDSIISIRKSGCLYLLVLSFRQWSLLQNGCILFNFSPIS